MNNYFVLKKTRADEYLTINMSEPVTLGRRNHKSC